MLSNVDVVNVAFVTWMRRVPYRLKLSVATNSGQRSQLGLLGDYNHLYQACLHKRSQFPSQIDSFSNLVQSISLYIELVFAVAFASRSSGY